MKVAGKAGRLNGSSAWRPSLDRGRHHTGPQQLLRMHSTVESFAHNPVARHYLTDTYRIRIPH